jgi:hypothetical protein
MISVEKKLYLLFIMCKNNDWFYICSNSSLEKERESDEESVISQRQPPMAEDTESINIPTKKR